MLNTELGKPQVKKRICKLLLIQKIKKEAKYKEALNK